MKRHFSREDLNLYVRRVEGTSEIILTISSMVNDNRKQPLYVNEKSIALDLEKFWKSIKTKKMTKVSLEFEEIDWYDDEIDVYTTPYIFIKRGLKRARVLEQTHGSIPKEWELQLSVRFNDTTTNTALLEVVREALGSFFDTKAEKQFKKDLKPFLQKKSRSVNNEIEVEQESYRSYYW